MHSERYEHALQKSRYELIEEIGRGGMGVVYRAYEATLDRTMALKLIAPALANQPGFVARLRREAISVARLRHPHIALLYEFGHADDTAFLAMEYVPGCSLRELLDEGPLPHERALAILEQIGQALDYAHGKGIVHRDVKPSNILVGPDDHATLIDFGLAEVSESTLLTSDGAVLGTPHYMAPEQAAGRSAGPHADQYALAAVAYELLTGAPPFHGRSATAVVHAHIYELPPPLTEQRPELPAAANAVLLRGLAKQQHERYATLAEFVAALRAALAPPAPPARRAARRRPLLVGGAWALALAAALLAVYLVRQAGGESLRPIAQAAPQSRVPLPQQVAWSYAPARHFAGGPAPVVSDSMLVLGTLDGRVLGLQAGSGELRWTATAGGGALFGEPSVSGGLVFAGSSDGFVQGLSLNSGKLTWQTRVVGVVQHAPTLDADRLVVITDKGYVYLLQAGSGQVIWGRPLAASSQPPAISGGRIFVGAGQTLFALDVSNGAVDWSFDAPDPITTRPVIAGDTVVVGTKRGLLYALQLADGRQRLRYQAAGALTAAPAASAAAIYVADQSGTVTAISRADARVLWRYQAGAAIVAAPLLAGERLFVGAADGVVAALDARSGEQLAHIQLGGSILAPPALGAGLVIVSADRLYGLGE